MSTSLTPCFVNMSANCLSPGTHFKADISLESSISLSAAISRLSLLSDTGVVEETAATRERLSTIPVMLIFSSVFQMLCKMSLMKRAFSSPSQRLRVSALKVDLTTLFILLHCQSRMQHLSLTGLHRSMMCPPVLSLPSLRLPSEADYLPIICMTQSWKH